MIGNRARAGAYATAAASQLLVVVPSHGLWIDANFKETSSSACASARRWMCTPTSNPAARSRATSSARPATGAQFSVLPASNATGNFTKIVQRVPVRIVLDGKDGELDLLRPGLSVKASINTKAS